MKKRMIVMVALTLGMAFPAFSAEGPLMKGVEGALDTFAEGCRTELTTFCKDVTPGEGRLLDCLKKNEAKVSSRRKTALKDVGWME